jgi:hypothetical protein
MTGRRRPGSTPTAKRVVHRTHFLVIVAALLIATAAVSWQIALVSELSPYPTSPIYPTPGQKPEVLLNAHDGKFFAAIAADPLLEHPDRVGPEVGQRAARPLWSWLAWIASFGNRDAIPWALMALTVFSIAALVGAIILLSNALGNERASPLALAIFGAPGVLAIVVFPGLNDAWGAALALAGFAAWKRDRTALALGAFAAAGLCHEALLICPLAVLIDDWRARHDRSVVRWLVALLPFVAWVAYVHVRSGAWPTDNSPGNLGAPFVGLVSSIREGWVSFDFACIVVIVLAGIVSWTKLRDTAFRLTIIGFGLVAVVLGPKIWARWVEFGRVLLPVCALAVVAMMREIGATRGEQSINRRRAVPAAAR